MKNGNNKISLLFPEGYEDTKVPNFNLEYDTLVKDLELKEIFYIMYNSSLYSAKYKGIFSKITDNAEIIRYRLEVIDDLLRYPLIIEELEKIIPDIEQLSDFSEYTAKNDDAVYYIHRIGELELYADCIDRLYKCLSSHKLVTNSRGLKKLSSKIDDIVNSESFKSLNIELPKMRKGFRQIASITVGINLDSQLRPVNATLVSINDDTYKPGDIIERFLRFDFSKDKYHGISPLDVVVKGSGSEAQAQQFALQEAINRSMNSIFKSAVKSFSSSINRFKAENSSFLGALIPEIVFYIGAIKLINTMKACGLPMCKPEVLSKQERRSDIHGIYNINLALKLHSSNPEKDLEKDIVLNDISFGDQGRIYVLTGANQGGKTTITQAVGLTHVLFQMGIYVPAYSAKLSPVDGIYTHFPVEEKETTYMGRLGEECMRLQHIFDKITSYSLVLLNESLTSTSSVEGTYIAKQTLLGLKLAECRAIFATHFHELAMNLEETNSLVEGDSRIESIVAGVLLKGSGAAERNYIIEIAPPQGNSYASDIADKFGISIDKIAKKVKENKAVLI